MTTVGIKIGKEVAVIDNPEFGVQVDVEIAFSTTLSVVTQKGILL